MVGVDEDVSRAQVVAPKREGAVVWGGGGGEVAEELSDWVGWLSQVLECRDDIGVRTHLAMYF